jgi:hypothetical protein
VELRVPLGVLDADRAPDPAQLIEPRAGQLRERGAADRMLEGRNPPHVELHAMVGAVLLVQHERVARRERLAREPFSPGGRMLGKAGARNRFAASTSLVPVLSLIGCVRPFV